MNIARSNIDEKDSVNAVSHEKSEKKRSIVCLKPFDVFNVFDICWCVPSNGNSDCYWTCTISIHLLYQNMINDDMRIDRARNRKIKHQTIACHGIFIKLFNRVFA